jgi:hypothetical protein
MISKIVGGWSVHNPLIDISRQLDLEMSVTGYELRPCNVRHDNYVMLQGPSQPCAVARCVATTDAKDGRQKGERERSMGLRRKV